MNILFFELEGWERPYLEKRLPAGHAVDYYNHKVTGADAQKLAGCDILSTFIFSQVNAEILRLAPALKLVATRSTGSMVSSAVASESMQ